MILESQACQTTVVTLRERVADIEAGFPPGE
jgi:hypothetical protein